MAVRLDNNAILSIDIGTTYLKSTLYDLNLEAISSDSIKLNVLQPQDGYFEIDPNELLDQVKQSIKNCIKNSTNKSINSSSIRCVGISTQRNSVLLWNKQTGEPYSNFILWNDKRDTEIADSLNYTLGMKGLKFGSSFLSTFVNNHRFIAFSKYRYATTHVSPKLLWILARLPPKTDQSKLLFGCIETWILWKLTKSNTHATDWSCASCTGFFDFFLSSWSSIICSITGVPKHILPIVNDTCDNYGAIDKKQIEGDTDIPVTAVVGDAQSSIIAECGFTIGDVIITIGTGAFISINCGDKPVSSQHGNYPLCGFKFLNERIFILHNAITTAGVAIEWAKSIGLFENYDEIEGLLLSVENSNGVYFVPSFGSVEVDTKDTRSAAAFIGLKPNTSKAHLLRSIIDSIAFGIKEKFDSMLEDLELLKIKVNSVRVCGGVARSNFLCNYLAYLTKYTIERSPNGHTSSSRGAAILAGLGAKIWLKKEDLQDYRKNVEFFEPTISKNNKNKPNGVIPDSNSTDFEKYFKRSEIDYKKWSQAIQRCMNWYE